jgi:dCTP deaminase
MLADFQIRKAVEDCWISVKPFREEHLNPVSLDLTLGNTVRTVRRDVQIIDTAMADVEPNTTYYGCVPSWHPHTDEGVIHADGYHLRPREFILASTAERIELSSFIAARVEGKSSLGRLGLLVHVTAGFVDPGFEGELTLEIANLSDVTLVLYAGMRVCQLTFETVEPPEQDYRHTGRYQGQTGPTESRYRHIR